LPIQVNRSCLAVPAGNSWLNLLRSWLSLARRCGEARRSRVFPIFFRTRSAGFLKMFTLT